MIDPLPVPPRGPIPVHLLLWDGVELLDFAGPGQVFAVAGKGRAFQVRTVAAHPGPLRSQGFLTILPELLLQEAPPAGILVIPGGSADRPMADPVLMEALRSAAPKAEVVFSVCTGARVLAAAGLLEGQTATTWYGALDQLREEAPGTRVLSGVRWVDNGRIVTAAGVSAGIDAALHLVQRWLGPKEARRVARYMEYGGGGGGSGGGSAGTPGLVVEEPS
jgi:transcriptional regulator GlxA family with amidase domain